MIVADLLPAGFEIESVLRPADGRREYGGSGAFAYLGQIANAQTAEAQDDGENLDKLHGLPQAKEMRSASSSKGNEKCVFRIFYWNGTDNAKKCRTRL